MNILLIGPVPQHLGSNNTGGIANHVWALANRLRERGEHVDLLAVGRYYKGTRTLNGIRVFGADSGAGALLKTLPKLPRLWAKIGGSPIPKAYFHASYSLFRLLELEEPGRYDVIHMHGMHNAALYALELLQVDVPKIVSVHSYTGIISSDERKTGRRLSFIGRYLESADGVVHVSDTDRRKGVRHGLNIRAREAVIHNGVARSGEDGNAGAGSRGDRICFVGYLTAHKRIPLFLDSIAYLPEEIRQIQIAGDGALRSEVERAAEKHPGVDYRGVVPNEQVRGIMRRSSVLVVPSLSESFGLVYIEALFEGAAVMGYAPTLEEFRQVMGLTGQEQKLVVPLATDDIAPRDLARMIAETRAFRQSPEGEQAMQRVRQKAIEHFSWEAVIRQMTGFYEEVIRARQQEKENQTAIG